jgi:hypothetical protein
MLKARSRATKGRFAGFERQEVDVEDPTASLLVLGVAVDLLPAAEQLPQLMHVDGETCDRYDCRLLLDPAERRSRPAGSHMGEGDEIEIELNRERYAGRCFFCWYGSSLVAIADAACPFLAAAQT